MGSGELPLVHAVGNAHIDPVWIWDWREGMHEVLQTFRSALDRLAESPRLIFTASSAFQHEWVRRTDPSMFAEIAQRVAEGRWVVVGGQWVEPDCNLPSGESVCRQLLYGQRWFARHLGQPATIGYNVDAFGHAGSLPQLLVRSGIRGYVMMRPNQDEHPLPANLFCWRGTDGTGVATYRIPDSYSHELDAEADEIPRRAQQLRMDALDAGQPQMLFFGVGDHGGGPTRRAIGIVEQLAADDPAAIGFASAASYFAAIAADADDGLLSEVQGDLHHSLPEVQGDLHHHAVGCYSALSWIKSANARAEAALGTAETLATLARATTGRQLDSEADLAAAWQSLLFSQFHDSLGGTCSAAACEDLRPFLGRAIAVADQLCAEATHAIAQQVDTWVAGAEGAVGVPSARPAHGGLPVPIIVFNPLSWSVRRAVRVSHPLSQVTDLDGNEVPCQRVGSGEVTYAPTRSLFVAEVPALGWRLYWLWARGALAEPAAQPDEPEPVWGSDTILENGLVRVEIDSLSGRIAAIVDRGSGLNLLGPEGIFPVVIDDPSDTWSHGVTRYDGAEQPCTLVDVDSSETGPVRSTIRLTFHYRDSEIVIEPSLVAGLGELELRVRVDWRERRRLLKLVVPLGLGDAVSAAGLPYGHAERVVDGGEEPMVGWVDVSGSIDGRRAGLACTASGKYAYDLAGSRLRLTALRSPRYADHGMAWGSDDQLDFPVTDQGSHDFSYRLHPHRGDWRAAGLPRRAAEHAVELPAVIDSWHQGSLPRTSTGLAVDPDSVQVTVFKRAQSAAGTVIRVWETDGRPVEAVVEGPALGRSWRGSLAPQEVVSLFIPDDATEPIVTTDIPELDLDAVAAPTEGHDHA